MQYDLDMIELGPIFQPNSHTSLLLVSLFIAMPFACGIPIFMPLSAAVFITYFRNDKKFLLRYYQQPYKAGNKIMKVVISLLPFAGIIRLAFGIWMLSNSDIFDGTIPDYNPNLASQAGAVNGAVSQGSSASGAGVDSSGSIIIIIVIIVIIIIIIIIIIVIIRSKLIDILISIIYIYR
jgi:hypothetical protein